ncbi:hypothetical protein D9M68_394780 [compost metagenome]
MEALRQRLLRARHRAQGLVRAVGGGGGLGADPARLADVVQLRAQRQVAQQVGGGQRVGQRREGGRGRGVEGGLELVGRERGAGHALQRVDHVAVPVGVEDPGRLRHHRAGQQQLEVDEVGALAAQEVLVREVAPAGDGHGAVGDEQLVVHAVVEPPEIAEELQPAQRRVIARVHERVEQPHLRVRLGGQPEQQAVHAGGVEVVEQQPHAHPAPGGVAQFAQQQAAGLVVAELVGLHVERGLGAADELQPRIERERGLDQRSHARQPVGRRIEAGGGMAERGGGRSGNGDRGRPIGQARRQAGAAGEHQHDQHQRRAAQRRKQRGEELEHGACQRTQGRAGGIVARLAAATAAVLQRFAPVCWKTRGPRLS